MRVKMLFFVFVFSLAEASAQIAVPAAMRNTVDSLLVLIRNEKDPVKRYDRIFDIYLTGAEAYPVYFLEIGNQFFQIAQKNKDQIAEASAWSVYGQAYRLTGNYIKAVGCHYKAIAIAEKIDNLSVMSYAQNQLGHIYKDREEYSKALDFYRRAKWYADQGKTEGAKVGPILNLGIIHLSLGNADSALYYSQQLMNRYRETALISYEWLNDGAMAAAYSKMKKKKEAEHYYVLSINAAMHAKNARNIETALMGIATHYQQNGPVDSFLYYAKMAVSVVDNTIYEYMRAKAAKMISDYYENVNADSAIRYIKINREATEAMNNRQVSQQIQVMSFEEEQRKAEIARAEQAYAQKIWIGVLIGGLLVLTAFLIYLFRNIRQKQKTNQRLRSQKKEIEEALEQLKETQTQLVQSEKMASLGELTAGIAHEIQNPLNFVNNFSDLNRELLVEMNEEIQKGNYEEVQAIAKDITDNEAKITHHGKRADAIVKSMLQHSRKNSGKKELTNVNTLCEEFLLHSYHGLRAKDKSFNSKLEKLLEVDLPRANIVAQDIGRVLLNLFNNAFYAVNARKKTGEAGYEPRIKVQTALQNNRIIITVTDNGIGIPADTVNKIFQPFFTTKPTGQGTGLGLSLSYDIVTKGHGGELTVTSVEGEGSTFTIQIPVA
jgi:two-component system NtrC family sensor kinase